jgi:membrane-associated protein
MTDWLLALVPTYGLWLLAAATFLSCLAIPIPASILMLAAGGFVAAGDLPLIGTLAAAVVGASTGDQLGYLAGRRGGARLLAWLGTRAAPVEKARALLERRGSVAVFFSRWLVSALGPYVNLAAGAAGLSWARFTLWGVLGESVWTGLYVGLGYGFTGNLAAASDLAWTILGFVGAAAVAIGLGYWLFTVLRSDGAGRAG